MHKSDFAYITLRVLSIYLFVQALLNLSHFANFLYIPTELSRLASASNIITTAFIFTLGPFLILVISSVVLWIFTPRFVRYLISSDTIESKMTNRFDIVQLQTIAFTVVGLILFTNAIPQIFRVIPNIMTLNEELLQSIPKFKYETIFSAVEVIVQLILGIILIFGSKGLNGVLFKVREMGLKKENHN